MALIAAAALFVVFLANILIGASGGTAFLNDVGEMLVLFGATLCFVVLILQQEATASATAKSPANEPAGTTAKAAAESAATQNDKTRES
ncbi:MAG: hypothetical protein AAFR46_09820 [Pseudomonadota bacterium]